VVVLAHFGFVADVAMRSNYKLCVEGHALDIPALIFAIAAGAVVFVVIRLWQKWATNCLAKRLVSDVLAKTKTADGLPKLKPESDFVVDVSGTGATCRRPDGKTESVKWNDLERVEILTTDEGPFAPDIFWVLYGSSDGCVIPWGATGETELLNLLQALPGFRYDVLVDAASLATNNQLLCWERTQQIA
jgi:hypothetical protein